MQNITQRNINLLKFIYKHFWACTCINKPDKNRQVYDKLFQIWPSDILNDVLFNTCHVIFLLPPQADEICTIMYVFI